MKVLITGGYGFIGSRVAERFVKEGDDVTIIDNMSEKTSRAISSKHRYYNINAKGWQCRYYMKNGKFDIVIHLAGKKVVDGDIEAFNANIEALTNMLELSTRYGVKKFVFLSSMLVYGKDTAVCLENEKPNPSDFLGLMYSAMEYYCELWNKSTGLDVVIVRSPEVYGPGQYTDNGVIADYIKKSVENRLSLEEEKWHNLIFIGDAVEAIYKAAGPISFGIYNISAKKSVSNFDIAKEIASVTNKDWANPDMPDISKAPLIDTTRATKELEWIPIYDIQKGIERTYEWIIGTKDQEHIKIVKKADKKQKQIKFKWHALIENLTLFFIIFVLTYFSSRGALGVTIDFRIMYIIIIGIFHGIRQSMIAAALSCVLYFFERMLIGADLKSAIYDLNIMLTIVQYLIIGASVGYMVERKNFTIDRKDTELERKESEYSYLSQLYDENIMIKEELEERLLEYGDSYGKLFKIISSLDALESEKILFSTFEVLGQVLKSNQISIYMLNKYGNYMRRVAASEGTGRFLPKSVRIEDFPVWQDIIAKKEMYVNNSLNPLMPSMAAPVIDRDRVLAIILVEHMDFEKLTLHYQNLFKVVVSLVSSAISRAYAYEEAVLEKKYIPETAILRKEEFESILKIKSDARRNNYAEYTHLRVTRTNNIEEIKQFSNRINDSIRDSDCMGVASDDYLHILLSNTNRRDAQIVINRLIKMGVETELVS